MMSGAKVCLLFLVLFIAIHCSSSLLMDENSIEISKRDIEADPMMDDFGDSIDGDDEDADGDGIADDDGSEEDNDEDEYEDSKVEVNDLTDHHHDRASGGVDVTVIKSKEEVAITKHKKPSSVKNMKKPETSGGASNRVPIGKLESSNSAFASLLVMSICATTIVILLTIISYYMIKIRRQRTRGHEYIIAEYV